MLDLKPREERDVILVELHAVHVVRHDVPHELLRLLVDGLGVDQDFADILMEVIADGANDEARFLIDQKRARLLVCRLLDRTPQLHEVAQIPLELFAGASDGRSAADDAHPLRDLELVDDIAKLVAVFAFDTPRDAAAARVVRHQHEIAAGETDKAGERGALVSALVLVDLDDDFLAFVERVLDARASGDPRRA